MHGREGFYIPKHIGSVINDIAVIHIYKAIPEFFEFSARGLYLFYLRIYHDGSGRMEGQIHYEEGCYGNRYNKQIAGATGAAGWKGNIAGADRSPIQTFLSHIYHLDTMHIGQGMGNSPGPERRIFPGLRWDNRILR